MAAAVSATVKIADYEPVRALIAGTAEAVRLFGQLSGEELAALPEAARDGIAALTGECGPQLTLPEDATCWGLVIVEWPAAVPGPRPMPSWKVTLTDAVSGAQIVTAERVVIRADASGFVTAELTMLADDDGKPVFSAQPDSDRPGCMKVRLDEHGKIRTGTFPFLVAEMRVGRP